MSNKYPKLVCILVMGYSISGWPHMFRFSCWTAFARSARLLNLHVSLRLHSSQGESPKPNNTRVTPKLFVSDREIESDIFKRDFILLFFYFVIKRNDNQKLQYFKTSLCISAGHPSIWIISNYFSICFLVEDLQRPNAFPPPKKLHSFYSETIRSKNIDLLWISLTS